MFKLLIDTCVWLDLAKDPRLGRLLDVIDELIKAGALTLLAPELVVEEFKRNRDRVAKERAKSVSSHFRIVREAAAKSGMSEETTKEFLTKLDDVNQKIPLAGVESSVVLDRIQALLNSGESLKTSDKVKLKAAQRAVEKKAPFHHGRNSMADALLIEAYAECVETTSNRTRYGFVTHNKSDFSQTSGNESIPHLDLQGHFSKIKSLYFISLPAALRRIEPSVFADSMDDIWNSEPRSLSDILREEDMLMHQVWYNRHLLRQWKIQTGKIKLVDDEPNYSQHTIKKEIWKGALKSAKAVMKKYGKDNLGPWTDFEWGMINGKLSALRWVLGYDWDMLDT